MWRSTSSTAKLVMLFQTVIIGFLSFWIYEEYLNNTYLQGYVNGVFAADGWAFASVAVVVLLLGVTTVFLRRNKSMEKRVESVSAGVKVSSPVPPFSKPSATDFHPVVAALKAELSGVPVPLGTPMSVPPVSPTREETPSAGAQTALANVPVTPQIVGAGLTRPETVIIGGMPVLKKVDQENKAQENRNGEKPPAQQP